MTNPNDRDSAVRRAEEAANILRRLDENPTDEKALQDREDFLARGKAERRIYKNIQRAFASAPRGLQNRDRRYVLAILGAILASLLIAWQPLQLRLLADHQTRLDPKIVTLKSGDLATLDAATALRDATDLEERRVSLLSGTGYFNVNSTGRRFIVSADGITAEAIGTEFEVSHVGDDVIVTVAEGIVDVSRDNKMTRLSEGQQLRVSTNDMLIRRLDSDEVAVWRADRLSLEGLTFAEAALIVGRRLPGRVIVLGSALQNTEVAGVLDLSEPDSALDTLAASSSAGVLRASTLLTILYAR